MALSLYDVSVPVFRQYLTGLSGVLAKAQAHGLDEGELAGFRFYEDMLPFTVQILLSITHSAGAVGVLRGQPYAMPSMDTLGTLAGAKAAIDTAIAYLDGVKSADITVGEEDDVAFTNPRGIKMTFGARDYVLTFAYGNFFFHITTAYDMLRHEGVPIGKRDFMGGSKMRSSS
jgi:uncharacterized protein